MDAVALTLRPADADDFDEIVKLSEGIYAGHDYLNGLQGLNKDVVNYIY